MSALNRRALFGAVPAAVAMAVPAAAMAADHAALDRECHALCRLVDRLDWNDDDAVATYHRRENVFLTAVEALPKTADHAGLRARAVSILYRDNDRGPMAGLIEANFDQQTTDQRLMCQIMASLWGEH